MATLKTNSKQVKQAVQSYILECIDISGHPDCGEDIQSKLKLICEEFKHAAAYKNNILRLKTWQAVFIDWLMGAPSAFSIEYYADGILKIMASWGLPLPANKDEQDGENLFRYLIFSNFVQLCNKNGIDFYSYCTY